MAPSLLPCQGAQLLDGLGQRLKGLWAFMAKQVDLFVADAAPALVSAHGSDLARNHPFTGMVISPYTGEDGGATRW
jgi:hypothetical protein